MLQTLKSAPFLKLYALFSQAAEQLHLTQPAVTKRIQMLELSAGCKLFDRIGRQVLLTSHHIGLHRLPKVLKEYKHLYPEVKLHISQRAGSIPGNFTGCPFLYRTHSARTV